jgi:NADH-quinone oxidoreductase subunit N
MNVTIPIIRFDVIGPEIILSLATMFLMLLNVFVKGGARSAMPYLSLAALLISIVYCLSLWGTQQEAFHQMVVLDTYGLFFKILFLLTTALTVLMSIRYLKDEGFHYGEYYMLLLLATVGMMLMAGANDLIIVFLGLETFSLALYVLAGFFRTQPKSVESSVKYFLLGAFSSGFLLYGIAMVYGAMGTTNLNVLYQRLGWESLSVDPLLFVGMGLLLVGFGFKIASVPFHMWTPDVYEGAPTSVTAFMAVGAKAAGFAVFLRVFFYSLGTLQADWGWVLWILAVLTMTLGNIVAIAQQNIKRMLAYSSIAHAGYLLVGMVAGNELGQASILYYLLAYAFMNLGAFGVVILVGRKGEENLRIQDYSGLAGKYPLLAAAMALFMFSLAGIPPTAGFVGKFYIFSAAVQSGFIGLAIIGVLNSALSVYYYLRVTVMMYMRSPEKEGAPLEVSPSIALAIFIAAFGTIYLGLLPSSYMDWACQSVLDLM